jgi:hypothetical protein
MNFHRAFNNSSPSPNTRLWRAATRTKDGSDPESFRVSGQPDPPPRGVPKKECSGRCENEKTRRSRAVPGFTQLRSDLTAALFRPFW